MSKLIRHQIADYLGIKGEGGTVTYHLMGTGFTKVDESPSPKVETTQYINNKAATSTITGYENSFAYDTDVIPDETAVAALLKVAHDQLTGADAEFEYVRVDLYDKAGETAGVYNARKFNVTCEVGDITGEAGAGVTTSGTLHQNGDFTPGTFNTGTKAFTAEAAA